MSSGKVTIPPNNEQLGLEERLPSADRVFGALVLLVSLGYYLAGRDLPLTIGSRPGPGLFPLVLAIAGVSIGTVMLVRRGVGPQIDVPIRRQLGKVGCAMAVYFAFVAALKPFGFAISSFVLLVGLLVVLERLPWRVALPVAVGVSGGFHLVFRVLLGVPLPSGMFGV